MNGRIVLLAACLAGPLGAALPAAAQERPGDPPAQDTVSQDTTPQDTVGPPPTLARRATLGYDPTRFLVDVTVGLPGTGEAQLQPVLVVRTPPAGAAPDTAVLDRVVRFRGAITSGLSAVLNLSRAWGLRIGAAYTVASLVPEFPVDDDERQPAPLTETANAAAGDATDVRTVDVEGTLRYRLPRQKRLRPYVEIGAVVSRWEAAAAVDGATSLAAGLTRIAATAALGGQLPVSERISARFSVSRRLFQTPLGPVAAGDTLARGEQQLPWERRPTKVFLIARDPPSNAFADGPRELLSLVRMEAGVSLALGAPLEAPPGPVAPADTTAPPGP